MRWRSIAEETRSAFVDRGGASSWVQRGAGAGAGGRRLADGGARLREHALLAAGRHIARQRRDAEARVHVFDRRRCAGTRRRRSWWAARCSSSRPIPTSSTRSTSRSLERPCAGGSSPSRRRSPKASRAATSSIADSLTPMARFSSTRWTTRRSRSTPRAARSFGAIGRAISAPAKRERWRRSSSRAVS